MRHIASFILILIMVTYGTALFAGPNPEALNVSILNWDGIPAGGIQFPNPQGATIDEPWILSPQYLRVTYSSDETVWGLRIITNNEINIGQVYPKPLNKGPDNQWEWKKLGLTSYQYVGGQWQTGDDCVSFNGLIDPATKGNPNYRVDLAWQVFRDPVPEPDPIYKDWQGVWNVGGNWNDDWAYVVDKSNRWNGQPVLGGVFYPGTWNQKYEMIVTGNPVVNYLAQHPVVSGSKENPDPKLGDCDIAVYLGACFVIMENGVFTSVLPAGNYGTVIYLELIHE